MSQNTDPKYVCQNILPRTPKAFSLWCTLDGRELPLQNDGGTYRNGKLVGPNARVAQAYNAVAKRNPDGSPTFVAHEPIAPSYVGDPLCTSTSKYSGAITLLAGEAAAAVEKTVKAHKAKIVEGRAEAAKKIKAETEKK